MNIEIRFEKDLGEVLLDSIYTDDSCGDARKLMEEAILFTYQKFSLEYWMLRHLELPVSSLRAGDYLLTATYNRGDYQITSLTRIED